MDLNSFLIIKDPSNLGRDTSGNGNNFTQDNFYGKQMIIQMIVSY